MNKTSIIDIIDKLTERATTKSVLALIIGGGGFLTLAKLALEGNPTAIKITQFGVVSMLSYYFGQEKQKIKKMIK